MATEADLPADNADDRADGGADVESSDHEIATALEAARARYEQERQKRMRPEGNAQYQELRGDHAEFDRDPYADHDFARDPIERNVDVVIIGAGFAGMMTAIELTKAGVRDFVMVEKGGDFGGTWYWNRYPGCMCDVESYTYLPLLEETGYMPTEKYASAPEIFAYCQLMGRHFDLYPHALFQTEIVDTVWDDQQHRWRVTTTRDDAIMGRFVVAAGGILNKAKLPGIAGIEDFEGHAFHTSRWDYSFTGGSPTEPMDQLAGKRVGIVGTGATAVQAVPRLAEAGAEVFVFQRTPSAVGVRNNGPTDEEWYGSLEPGWQQARVENFTEAVTGAKPEENLVGDGWTATMWEQTNRGATSAEEAEELELEDFAVMQSLRDRVDETIEDPELADALKPWYGKHCKRLCFHDEYLPSFNRPNVHLVNTDGRGVEQLSKAGVVVDDDEYPLDLLIFASGFEVTTDLHRRLGFDPAGRDGLRLSERWHDGAHTLHGVLSAEFPNLMVISVVQAGFGVNFVHFLGRSAHHIAWLVDHCLDNDIVTIEATPEAEEEWLGVLYSVIGGLADYSATCTPGYYNSEGSRDAKAARNLVYAGSLMDYADRLREWRESGDLPGAKVTRA